ncbi:MAG: MerR family transcriptional regulator, partial [Verrucomicrobia bacterium]
MAYSIEQVARITHTSRHTIAVYCRLGVIEPLDLPDRPGWHFDDEAIRTLSRAEHIRREHGVNLRGTAIILRLLDRIEALQDELR